MIRKSKSFFLLFCLIFPGLSVGKLNVTIESNTSFTIYWGDNLIQKYVCYSAEWRTKGGETVHMSFFQGTNNYRTLSPLPGWQKT